MLRTSLAVIAMTLLAGAAQAAPVIAPVEGSNLVITVANDATSESDAIQLDQNTEPSSGGAMQNSQPSTPEGSAEQKQMQESDDINN